MKVINGIIVGASILCGAIYYSMNIPAEKEVSEISVFGRAEIPVKADHFSWVFRYYTTTNAVEEAKEAAKSAKKIITTLLDDCGLVLDEDYTIQSRELPKKTDYGKDVFEVYQDYYVSTQKIEAAEKAYKSSEQLIDKGIGIDTSERKLQIKDTKKIEKELIDKAIANARERANELMMSIGAKPVGAPSITIPSYQNISVRDSSLPDNNEIYSFALGMMIDKIASLIIEYSIKVKK